MPIKTRFKVKHISDKEFYSLDYQIMGLVFEIHKEFGPFCDEKIYKFEIAERCYKRALGTVQMEEPIYVSYQDFSKKYYSAINHSAIKLCLVNCLRYYHHSYVLLHRLSSYN